MRRDMQKLWLILGAVLIVGGCTNQAIKEVETELPEPVERTEQAQGIAELMINSGETIATYSGQVNEQTTVLGMLTMAVEEDQLAMEIKEYDFGTMVEAIDGKKNTKDRAWIYYVNGKAGEVGAQDKRVMAGDLVEWKYVPPIY